MKKRIKDLKVNDCLYIVDSNRVNILHVFSVSRDEIKTGGSYSFKMSAGDETRFSFPVRYSSYFTEYPCFTEEIDAYKLLRERREKVLESVFQKQKDFFEEIKKANQGIREVDEKIADLLKQ